jgi:phage baseplate assembly protein gpV
MNGPLPIQVFLFQTVDGPAVAFTADAGQAYVRRVAAPASVMHAALTVLVRRGAVRVDRLRTDGRRDVHVAGHEYVASGRDVLAAVREWGAPI